jgi:hypothetical protein
MCKYYQILRKYVSEYNFYDTLDFLRENKIHYLTYEKNKKIQLKYKNILKGGDFSGLAKFEINSEYVANIDEYYDTLDENKKYINFIKLNAIKDDKGDYQNIDHCAVLIIDFKRKNASIQSLNNYNDCIKCKKGNEEFKIGDVLMRIILAICNKEKIQKISLSDMSYFLCIGDKIPLMYLRTLTKGEPYYCKFGFIPKYDEDIEVWKFNKNKFVEKPSMTKKELIKILMYRKFDESNLNDKKILFHINNNIIPKLQDDNIISDFIKMIIECKSDYSCHLLHVIYMTIYYKLGYKEYKNKTFILKNT